MLKFITLVITIIVLQGCTAIGVFLDSKYPSKPHHGDDLSHSVSGFEADVEIVKSLIETGTFPGNEPNQKTGCNAVKEKDKKECLSVAKSLTESISKHIDK